jgi:hypothetical protein
MRAIQTNTGGQLNMVFSGDRFRALTLFVFALTVCLFACSCSKSNNAIVESAPAYQPSPTSAQLKIPTVVAAKLPEVQEAVRRVFKDSAVVDGASNPSFFTGDFNGDASQDLAVVVKPAPGKLAEMNEEYPTWLLRDPFSNVRSEKASLSVDERDVLLAIIHGYGDNDWRDSQATQTFLLKNSVGNNMTVQTSKDFLNAHSGRKLPRPQGDLISQTVRGTSGYLYYASSNYEWYDPKTFRTKSAVSMVHGAR